MDTLRSRLEMGQRFFDTGSYNTSRFHEFFDDFKKSFTYQLRKLRAKEISFSKGHFYISGFFKVGDQYYYFSLSDVRDGVRTYDEPKLLVRTAKSPEDYTGGANNFIVIENGMYKNIARQLRIELPTSAKRKGKTNEEIAQGIVEKGFADIYVGSMKKANFIAWKVDALLRERNTGSMRISVAKSGNSIAYAKASTDELDYRYDGWSKRIEIQIIDKPFNKEAFLKTLKLPSNPQYRRNPFSGDGETLEPLAVALYDFIKEAEIKRSPLFQDALLTFREKYPDEYMTLLD